MLKTVIVDDEELAVIGLRDMLGVHNELKVCHTFTNPLDAYAYAKTNSVDLAFLDISMPEIHGMRLSSLLLQINAAMDIVFVTGYDNYAVQAFDMSALDYLMKPITPQRLSKTLEKLRKKHQGALIEGFGLERQKILTRQENRTLELIGMGLSNREISRQLGISVETVRTYIKNIYNKLDVNNRVQALQRAKHM